jgi:hypothetical protein
VRAAKFRRHYNEPDPTFLDPKASGRGFPVMLFPNRVHRRHDSPMPAPGCSGPVSTISARNGQFFNVPVDRRREAG